MTRHEVYADNAGTTRPLAEVVEAMQPFLADAFGNASSVHRRGEAAREAVENARARVARLIGALPEEIIFTASGSEANNLAIKGVLGVSRAPRQRLIVSAIEHPSVLEVVRHLESHGRPVTTLPVSRDGIVRPEALAEALGDDVALVSIMAVNNEIGTIQPVAALAALAHEAGARFHTDAVQAAGKLAIDVKGWDVDFLSIAAHKIHGPLGAAALHARRRERLVPLIHGGHQERSRRAGTENAAAIVGFGVAADLARERLETDAEKLEALGGRLASGLLEALPGARVHGSPRVPGIVNVWIPGVDGEALLHALDTRGITISTGSACSAASEGPSHVLLALGMSVAEAHASVRISLSRTNGEEDVNRILFETPEAARALLDLNASATRPPA